MYIFFNRHSLGIGDWGLGIGDWPIPNPQYKTKLKSLYIKYEN